MKTLISITSGLMALHHHQYHHGLQPIARAWAIVLIVAVVTYLFWYGWERGEQ